MKKYYAKFREIYDRDFNKIKDCYSPVIVINGRHKMICNDEEIIECETREEARKIALETYHRYIEHKKLITEGGF